MKIQLGLGGMCLPQGSGHNRHVILPRDSWQLHRASPDQAVQVVAPAARDGRVSSKLSICSPHCSIFLTSLPPRKEPCLHIAVDTRQLVLFSITCRFGAPPICELTFISFPCMCRIQTNVKVSLKGEFRQYLLGPVQTSREM